MRYQGKITNWNDDKGYGFVEPNGGGDKSFVHIKSFDRANRRPVNGDIITYDLVQEKDGRYKAAKISFPRRVSLTSKGKRNDRKLGTLFTVGFWIFLVAVTYLGKLPIHVLAIYIVTSIIAFVAYALDKSAAKNGQWRIQESTLHLFAIVGGWPGAFYAQNKLRHKSSKSEFKSMFWFTVLINVGVLFYLLTESGSDFVRSILSMLNL